MSTWNEAMHYFNCTPARYRKLFVVKRDCRDGKRLVEYSLRRLQHLVLPGVEIWELDSGTGQAEQVFPRGG